MNNHNPALGDSFGRIFKINGHEIESIEIRIAITASCGEYEYGEDNVYIPIVLELRKVR